MGLESVVVDDLNSSALQPEPTGHLRLVLLPLLAVVAAIAACEWIFVYRDVAYGIAIALFLALAIYLVNALLISDTLLSECLATLALIPLYILFTSSLPWFFIDQQYLIPAVYSVVLILCFFYIYHKRLDFARIFNFQWNRLGRYLLLGLVCGLPLA